ncbi:MAG: hypothetical protein AMXMBFR83_04760 [Phycisphaerae bacterium]
MVREDRQFIPYIQLHEYEAPLLVDPGKLDCEYLKHDEQIKKPSQMVKKFQTPGLIDEGEDTAPSKRMIQEIKEYQFNKARVGSLVAEKIGLAAMRAQCPHFHGWVSRLEALGQGC